MAPDPFRYFRLEAREILDQFSQAILDLEKSGNDPPLVQRLLRLAHTLKGAARVVKLPEIADQAHAIEGVLMPFRESTKHVARAEIDAVLACLDEIGSRVGALTAAEENVPTPARPFGDDGFRVVRADVAELDTVLSGISETHTLLNGLRTAARTMEQAQHLADLIEGQLSPHRLAEPSRGPIGAPDRLLSMAEELRRRLGSLDRNLDFAVDQMDRELEQLRDAVEQLRLFSAGTLFAALERTARDAARAVGKQVIFEGKGADIRLDGHVLGTIQGALIQVVRNAVAHGLEPAAIRRAAGKPEIGRVIVAVSRLGRTISFECYDDGRGLDLDAIRRVAAQRGLPGAEAARLGADALIRLLLRGGISTSSAVTEISGRGVGLDVVREAVSRLQGEVTFSTESGKGTRFGLVVPLALAAMDALLIEASGTVAAIPLDVVRGSMRLGVEAISHAPHGATVLYERQAVPFLPLSKILDGKPKALARNWSAVVVSGGVSMAALGVDRLLGTARIVMRPLPEFVPASAIVAGVCFDAEGNPQLVLDPDGLIDEIRRADTTQPEPPSPERKVLVIDDSLTTRMLERSILESAGYEVDVALSAEEGLESARCKRYGLFLVDVEMPGMDGFAFVERIRSDPLLHEVPAILVTSRAAPEDRSRGQDVGAQGYIVKSEFDQAAFLTTINALMN